MFGAGPQAPSRSNSAIITGSQDLSRSNSGAKPNDRLQERLSRAVVKKRGEVKKEISIPNATVSGASTPSSNPDVDLLDKDKTTVSAEVHSALQASVVDLGTSERPSQLDGSDERLPIDLSESKIVTDGSLSQSTSDITTPATVSERASLEYPPPSLSKGIGSGSTEVLANETVDAQSSGNQSANGSSDLLRREIEHEALESRLQEEIHPYVEKIDALQSKLQYLSREAAESAQQAAAAAQPGTIEKKLSEKDEKIALLLEEGQKLSRNEMKHLSVIKTLRSQTTATAKEQSGLKSRIDVAEKNNADMEQRALRAERKLQASMAESLELGEIKRERTALTSTIAEMKADLLRVTARAEIAERRVQVNDSERLRRQNEELRDDLTSAKVEHQLAEEKLRREVGEFAASVTREKERFNAMETEMLGEQAALEGKLESLRSRAEEVSSATHGDSQTKMLRQVETLQTQYSVASENWQGIEGSLLSRIASVEQERDEVTKRETELRRKVRETALKARKTQQELEEEKDRIQDLEKSMATQHDELQQSVRKAQQNEELLLQTRKTLSEQQELIEKEVSRRLNEERARWTPLLQTERLASPVTSVRKSSAIDLVHLMSPTHSRRPSTLPTFIPGSYTPPRQSSTASFRAHVNGVVPQTPSIHSTEHDDYFSNGLTTPILSAHTHRGVNDLISTSTVGAGPSVQLVERMSASVRRLESEKADAKDELARLTTQRDEARKEVVSLMREVEAKRANDERVAALEEEQRQIAERYQTTLELLGEKTEKVEELKADVADVKQMYRDLVENTMK